jgi:ribA/ribD-fused uncharacterized protein
MSRRADRFTFFFRSESPFSQWYPARFSLGGHTFRCAEQYMMYGKAILFGDAEIAAKILDAAGAKQQKALGRNVRHFNEDIWKARREQIVADGNRAKFTQNPEPRRALLETAGTELVEASPFDRIWGIGLAATDRRAQNRSQWRGQNLLGQILTRLRDEFLAS